jgi:hypothetical protein
MIKGASLVWKSTTARLLGGVLLVVILCLFSGGGPADGANLLVVDPQAQGHYGLRQAVCRFLRGVPWPCPEAFRNRLA